ncbi:MAG: hypothetical protein RLZZ77_2230 [Bacteroidota bacterium]
MGRAFPFYKLPFINPFFVKHLTFIVLSLLSSIAYSQNEAQWIRYSSISPDGKTIVFSYKGDLYAVGVDGGEAQLLTLSEGYDFNPIWSPDGKQIAFASDRNGNFDIFIMPAKGGAANRLTFHSSGDIPCDFTPDGNAVVFFSSRLDAASNQQFPSGALPELYSVAIKGGREKQVLTTPAIYVKYNKDGSKMLYQDVKGYEDEFRKHHTSSVTRDLWEYNTKTGEHQQLTTFSGEDLNPLYSADGQSMYYLSDQSGNMNVYKYEFAKGRSTALTQLIHHPARQLSISDNGILCFNQHGTLYTLRDGGTPQKVTVTIPYDDRFNQEKISPVAGASEVAVSPNGKEIAFVYRGEVFAASVAEGTTKRITNTPEQERSVGFSPDGRTLVYAGERNNSWNIYTATIQRKDEKYFFQSTLIKEEVVVETPEETFQPAFSPDGKEIAFIAQRQALKVVNLSTKAIREIVPYNLNYSYADGDQHYHWSPDGKWFLVSYLPDQQWISQIGLVSADGKGTITNLSHSGYGAYGPSWMMDGKMFIWSSPKNGKKNHASWGGEMDVYATFLTQEAFDEFNLNKEDYELFKENQAAADSSKKETSGDAKKSTAKKGETKKGEKAEEKKDEIKPITIQLDGIDDRKRRLTPNSSDFTSAYVSKDGSKLYYLTTFEKGYDLWESNLRTKETKVLAKLGTSPGGFIADKEGKNLFLIADGQITKIDLEKGEPKPIAIKGEMVLNENAERAYLFEHIWRQVREKFYVKDLHKVDWDFYKKEYARVLPEANNNYDFAEMMKEMLGELNASHTGAYYWKESPNGDQTASLGLFYDQNYTGNGLKIAEVMRKNPMVKNGSKIKAGVVIEKIDGQSIAAETNYYPMLNRKVGVPTLLSLYDPATNQRWDETVKPIHEGVEYELRYQRWLDNCRHIVDSVSNGKVGYVHVRSMDDGSYREVFDQTLGKYQSREALIVDTRFNGGGWLHDDLATFLSGKEYINMLPRDQKLGYEPLSKWTKPSVVVMNESNYSDAHLFPYTYRALGIGKLVGMPVAGTGTAVWWEMLQNGVVFGIPQVGMVDVEGDYLENKQLNPDVKVANEPAAVGKGRDQQLEKAVEVLLKK